MGQLIGDIADQDGQDGEPVEDPAGRVDAWAAGASRYRADIQGLRAIAILLIVGYHAGAPGFSGGFIGVDVFFVISGYLITRHLLRESIGSGAVDLGAFWARRVRRLVPALGLMVIVTLTVSLIVITPFDVLETAKQGASAAVYLSNILFAQSTQNYFGSNPNKSPFLHTWSLGVEEQFYLIWPFLALGLLWFARKRNRIHRQSAIVVFALIMVASFALNLAWTDQGSPWAFFSLPTRAWEFAAGGLLGCLAVKAARQRVVATIWGLAGLALLAYGMLVFDASTSYPGAHALVPVIGTLLLILAGSGTEGGTVSPVAGVLGIAPMQWIGRISYSWYLWHWPFIVLTVLALNDASVAARSTAALVSLGAAYVALRLVEDPLRFRPSILRSTRNTYVLGIVVTVAALAVAGATWEAASSQTPSSFKAQSVAASKNLYPGCYPQRIQAPPTRARRGRVPPRNAVYCFGGLLSSKTTVALVGDSHAAIWFNELSQVAIHQRVRVLLLTNAGCPFIPIQVNPEVNGPVSVAECVALRKADMDLLASIHPVGVILTQHSRGYLGFIRDSHGMVPGAERQRTLWEDAFRSFLTQMTSARIRPAVILDNPELPEKPSECVSQTGSITQCESTRAVALAPGRELMSAEGQVLIHMPNVRSFSPDKFLCNPTGCPLMLHGHLLYVDTNHMYFGATQLMEGPLSSMLTSIVSPGAAVRS